MAILSNRFNHGMPVKDVYSEIYDHLKTMKHEEIVVPLSDMRVDLRNSNLIVGETVYSLGTRAEAMLCSRLDIGNVHNVLSAATYANVEQELNEHIKGLKGSLTLKHRGPVVTAIVSEKYNEIPYDSSVQVLEDLGARPIRVTTNDAILKVQAIFDKGDFDYVLPTDGKPVSLGVQMQTSDVGASSLQFDVFTYRWICSNGMVMGKSSIFKFRKVHVTDRGNTAAQVDQEVKRVLTMAREEIERRTNILVNKKVDREAVVKFIAAQPFGKKATAMLAEKVVAAHTMYDVVNVLTEAGHDPIHSASLQAAFEVAAGELMMVAA